MNCTGSSSSYDGRSGRSGSLKKKHDEVSSKKHKKAKWLI